MSDGNTDWHESKIERLEYKLSGAEADGERLREAIESACAALRSPTLWSKPEYLKRGVPQIADVLHEALKDPPRSP